VLVLLGIPVYLFWSWRRREARFDRYIKE
jgi:hypothetical protein